MRIVLLAAVLTFAATTAMAAQNNGGGGGGLGFSCGEPSTPNFCSCTGGIDGTDCKNMKKNCTGDITCPPLLDNCTCKYVPAKAPGGGGKTLQVPKAGTLQKSN
jgi:hypothetical protein